MRSRNILCGGTIYGTRQSIMNFISIFWNELTQLSARNKTFGSCDQALINYLAYNVLGDWAKFDTFESDVATLYHTRLLTFNRTGQLVNDNGVVIPVLHQYDRLGPFVNHIVGNALSGAVAHA